MNNNIDLVKQSVIMAYEEVIKQNLSPFAGIGEKDPFYITLRYSGRVLALQNLAAQGYDWAAKDYLELMRIMESPIRRFLVAIEDELKIKNIKPPF